VQTPQGFRAREKICVVAKNVWNPAPCSNATPLPFAGCRVGKEELMPKPPKATPNSDIDGVHQDEKRNTDVATELGNSAEELDRAQQEAAARPDYVDDQEDKG
jgi:hypothetical protein